MEYILLSRGGGGTLEVLKSTGTRVRVRYCHTASTRNISGFSTADIDVLASIPGFDSVDTAGTRSTQLGRMLSVLAAYFRVLYCRYCLVYRQSFGRLYCSYREY